jgi:hypothetical protein
MATSIYSQLGPAARRAEIERIIAAYPDISDAELYDVFQYFRNDASRRDKRRIATNPLLRGPYRQLCHDHRLDRLGMVGKILGGTFVAVLAAGAAFIALGLFE